MILNGRLAQDWYLFILPRKLGGDAENVAMNGFIE